MSDPVPIPATNMVRMGAIGPRYFPGVEEFGRNVEISTLAKHIKRHGMYFPLVVDKEMNLISGWRRLAALRLAFAADSLVPIISGDVLSACTAMRVENTADPYPEMRVTMTMSDKLRLGCILYDKFRVEMRKLPQNKYRGTKAASRKMIAPALGISDQIWQALRPMRIGVDPAHTGWAQSGYPHSHKLALEALRQIDEKGKNPRRISTWYLRSLEPALPAGRGRSEWERIAPNVVSSLQTAARAIEDLGAIPADIDVSQAKDWGEAIGEAVRTIRKLGMDLRKWDQPSTSSNDNEETDNA